MLAPHLTDPSPDVDRFDRVVRLAQHVFDVPMVAVHLVDDRVLHPIANTGLPPDDMPRDGTFCAAAVDSGQRLVVPDARDDERFDRAPFVVGDPHVRFYAGEPLTGPGGQAVGTLCLLDERPRQLSEQESKLLRDLADWVEKELALDAEGAQAREVQRRLLPRDAVNVLGYDVAGRSTPARNVGGDYFDWQLLSDGQLQVVVADVMGKGITAAVLAAGVRSVMRGTSRFNGLAESVRRTSASIEEDLVAVSSFVTMFAARLVPASGEIRYVDAGHGLAIIIQTDGEIRRLSSKDLPLGALPEDTWEIRRDRLQPGETLLVVSDGILDLFPDAWTAVKAAVALSEDVPTADGMAAAIAGIGAGEPLDDDVTAVVVRRAEA